MLEVANVHVCRGDVRILHGLSLEVNEGEIVALIGSNGAGKTTTLRSISGLIRPESGEITLNGRPIQQRDPWDIVDLGVAHVPEGREVFRTMTVEENLVMGSYLSRARRARWSTIERTYALFPRLKERRRQLAGTLSGGEQQMLAIARGLMSLPRILLLDEPSLGLASILVKSMFETVRRIRYEGVTVLLVEQNVRQALEIADRAYVIESGRLVLSGPCGSVLGDARVQRAYLGVLGEGA